MPKVEIKRSLLLEKIGKNLTNSELESMLEIAKAELDEINEDDDKIKIEFNDTNRPDLWSYTGLARQIRSYLFKETPRFNFFSSKEQTQKYYGEILVDPELLSIRPFIFGFIAKGCVKDDFMLETLIQLQEKLCQNYGQKRKRIAMGLFSSSKIQFPLSYKAVDAGFKFIPLGMSEELSLLEINKKHPKGIEYSHILSCVHKFPLILDNKGKVLSYPPIINSNDIGAVKVGDSELFVEMSGTNLEATLLALSVVAVDFYDMGFKIFPVKTIFNEDTEFGREIVAPFYFQEPVEFTEKNVNKLLGSDLSLSSMVSALKKMSVEVNSSESKNFALPPVYRNDFLHEVDVAEDIMIGNGLLNIEAELPKTFTIGRLSQIEEFGRKVRKLMVGMGFQEMIYNYLGSRKDFIEKMNLDSDALFLQVSNPMTENYEYIRASIIPNLLKSESVSANAIYPHKIFEIGKVALKDSESPEGTNTYDHMAFLMADKDISFNEINSVVMSLFYFLDIDYSLKESNNRIYIKGRSADIIAKGNVVGNFGELHPEILNNFGIDVPCSVLELNLNYITILK